ncbi:MAG: hypothetical protein IH600_14985 [Bacteroidetes bacterium]|nr:hypothetical protein [Bacteroidota bacterium]
MEITRQTVPVKLRGNVRDRKTHDPIVGAMITFTGANGEHQTQTDMNGDWIILAYPVDSDYVIVSPSGDAPVGVYAFMSVSAIDYQLLEGEVRLKSEMNVKLDPIFTK